LYAVLIDLTDTVAEDSILDPIRYLADEPRELGILKRPRKRSRQKNPPEPPPISSNCPLTIHEIA